ncbi:MAG TPA: hypothetical protein VF211_10835 [Burkholderiales bacterium]
MEPGRSIGRLGFKRWYERQLIECHLWLVSCFLCGIAVLAVLEAADLQSGVLELADFGLALAAGLIAWHALMRYSAILRRAENLARQSTCPSCGRYAAYEVLSESSPLEVRCRKCASRWRLQ